jgi:hypothetical protein
VLRSHSLGSLGHDFSFGSRFLSFVAALMLDECSRQQSLDCELAENVLHVTTTHLRKPNSIHVGFAKLTVGLGFERIEAPPGGNHRQKPVRDAGHAADDRSG